MSRMRCDLKDYHVHMIKQANFKLLPFVKSQSPQSHHAMQVVLATIKDLLRTSLMRLDIPNTWTSSSSLVQAAVQAAESFKASTWQT
jgi:hypothetical protein